MSGLGQPCLSQIGASSSHSTTPDAMWSSCHSALKSVNFVLIELHIIIILCLSHVEQQKLLRALMSRRVSKHHCAL